MARLLILNPNTDTFGRQSIPTALISALLKKNGHSVELFDTTFMDLDYLLDKKQTHENLILKLNFFKKVDYSNYNLKKEKVDFVKLFEKKIQEYNPDFIAFSFWSSHLHGEGEFHAYFHGLKIIENADLKNIPVIVGGTVPTWEPIIVLKNPKINYVVMGEGELVYLDIANSIDAGKGFSGIKNLCIDDGKGGMEKNVLRDLIDPLDDLPYADFDIYDDRCFYRPYHGKMVRCIDYELSRGCVYNCTFCLSPFQRGIYNNPGNFRREKSIEKIVGEIGFLKNRYKLDMIRYQDETFLSMNEKKLEKLSLEYKKNVNLPFIIEAAVNTITENKIKSLKEMGCISIGLGIESGSKFIRDKIIKKPGFTNEEIIDKIGIIKKNGISMNLFNIIGFPEETREMIFETIELNYRAKAPYSMVSYFQPWEGTRLRNYSIESGYLDEKSAGLENSQDNLTGNPLSNLKISKEELGELHSKFSYYIRINKIFWPLIDIAGRSNIFSRSITQLLKLYLNLRMRVID